MENREDRMENKFEYKEGQIITHGNQSATYQVHTHLG